MTDCCNTNALAAPAVGKFANRRRSCLSIAGRMRVCWGFRRLRLDSGYRRPLLCLGLRLLRVRDLLAGLPDYYPKWAAVELHQVVKVHTAPDIQTWAFHPAHRLRKRETEAVGYLY
jgi:hypothetical protein